MNLCRLLRFVFAAHLVVCGVASADPQWHLRSSSGPAPRGSMGLVFDNSATILVGGTGNQIFGDMWKLIADGYQWQQLNPQTIPPARYVHGMAALGDGRILLFGGSNSTLLTDTWIFENGNWVYVPNGSNGAPSYGYAPAMAYDSYRNVVVLFGGSDGVGTPSSDTWEFDVANRTWVQRSPVDYPSARYHAAMAFDPIARKCILFGGTSGSTQAWYWDGADWATGPAGPAGRFAHSMTFDLERNRTVLFGGTADDHDCLVGKLRDTWFLDSGTGTWTRGPDGPPSGDSGYSGMSAPGLTYDSTRKTVVLFGGALCGNYSGETWELPSCDDPPQIVQDPNSQTVNCGALVTLSADASSVTPMQYQWRHNGLPLSDGATGHGSEIAGATTSILTIKRTQSLDAGAYDCNISNGCGSSLSATASLGVQLVPIVGDLNGDSVVDITDLALLLSNYGRECH